MLTLFIAISLLIIDQLSKFIILKNFQPGESFPVIKNIFHISFVCNRGAAFGIFSEAASVIFICISIVCVLTIVFISAFNKNIFYKRNSTQFFLALIFVGAIGNLIDRIRFGFVIDFLDFRIWPVFNIADSAITVGTILLLYSILKKPVTRVQRTENR